MHSNMAQVANNSRASYYLSSTGYDFDFTNRYENSTGDSSMGDSNTSPLSAKNYTRKSHTRSSSSQSSSSHGSGDYILRSPIQLENNPVAIRMRNFSFPNFDVNSEIDPLADSESKRQCAPPGKDLLSKYHHRAMNSGQSSLGPGNSYPSSEESSPRRSANSRTCSSLSSFSVDAPILKGCAELSANPLQEHVHFENESENLFNQLRSYRIGSQVDFHSNSDKESHYDEADLQGLRSAFLRSSRKSSLENPGRQLQEFKKRQSLSRMSTSSIVTPQMSPQMSPRGTFHKRASAISDSQHTLLFDNSTFRLRKNLTSESEFSACSGELPKLFKIETTGYCNTYKKHSTVPSPKLTIENTKEQIRRNSNGHFENFHQFAKLNGIERRGSVFACLPETGDSVTDPKINLDFVTTFKMERPPRYRKSKTYFEKRLASTISEEGSSSQPSSDSSSSSSCYLYKEKNSNKDKDDEMLTLIDFLKTD